ncbi:MAG: MFS transporter [Candidatus Poribacteria bacterium]
MSINHYGLNDTKGIKLVIRAFQFRNYRLFFTGQFITLIGTWIQQIAMSWLVYRLTNSAFLLGLVSFSGQLPSVFLSPITGVFADRWSRRKILIFTQSCNMIQAITLSILVLTDTIAVWHIIALGIIAGIVFTFDGPARQSFVIEMVEDKAYLGNAIALNSFMFNGSRLIGPSIGGILISAVGEGYCFLVNGITYLAVISALLAMRITPRQSNEHKANIIQELKEGFSYTFSIPPIRSILLLLGH